MTLDEARKLLEDNGFVVMQAKSYWRAQERQRIAEVMREDYEERMTDQDKWWREVILPRMFGYQERITFLYGAARAAGCTVEDLRGSA